MDINTLLLWMALIQGTVLLITFSRARVAARGWQIELAALLAATLVVWALAPAVAGYVAALLLLAIYVPTILFATARRLLMARRFQAASHVARAAALFHPWDAIGRFPLRVQAQAFASEGRTEEALAILSSLLADPAQEGPVRLEMAALTGRYDELIEWVRSQPHAPGRTRPDVLLAWMSTLARQGKIDELMALFEDHRPFLERTGLRQVLVIARRIVAVAAGRVDLTERLCDLPPSQLHPELRKLTIARARLAGGDVARAREELEQLTHSSDAVTRAAANFTLTHGAPAPTLSPRSLEIIARLDRDIRDDHRFGLQRSSRTGAARTTWTLVAVNTIVFGIELIRGGSTDNDVLVGMGALVTRRVAESGEWWRLGAAMFLHYGPWHLLMNMGGLLLLGPPLERMLGRLRFTVLYFAAGLGSMVAIFLTQWFLHISEPTVGASGAIMAIVGGLTAVMLDGWRRHRAHVARRQLVQLLAIVALQVVFDVFTPQVSFTGHFAGVVLGFLLTLVLVR